MNENILQMLAITLGSGGIIAGIVAWRKLGPEKDRTTVSVAEGAVIVQAGVIESLRQEIVRLSAEVFELRKALAVIDERKQRREDGE